MFCGLRLESADQRRACAPAVEHKRLRGDVEILSKATVPFTGELDRGFAAAPSTVQVADFTHTGTWEGLVYSGFAMDGPRPAM